MTAARSPSDFSLPRYMARKGRAYYFVTKGPKRKWIPLGTSLSDALEHHKMLLQQLEYTAPLPLLPEGYTPLALMSLVRRSSRARGIALTMAVEDLERLIRRARGRCEVSGLPFSAERPEGQRMRLRAPSVDRIDSRVGYTPENCRLVCAAVNVALNRFGDAFLAQMRIGAKA